MIINFSGGGTSLNFNIVGGTSAPINLKKNTIWIETDVPISEWAFSHSEPVPPVDNQIWVVTGQSGKCVFNALKKNYIEIRPMSAKQYIGGVWVDKTARIYQESDTGELDWNDWIVYLYDRGKDYEDITGGYEETHSYAGSNGDVGMDIMENSIRVEALANTSGTSAWCGAVTMKTIDLTNINTLYASGYCSDARNGEAGSAGVGLRVTPTKEIRDYVAADKTVTSTGDFTISLDVSALDGAYYVICYAFEDLESGYSNGTTGAGEFYSIWY